MFGVAIAYLIMGHTDYIIRYLHGNRNRISISIFKTIRLTGWVMLIGAFFGLFYDSYILNFFYLAILFTGLKIARVSRVLLTEGDSANEGKRR